MSRKGPTAGDVLIVIAIVLGSAVLVGAILGYSSNRFGLPASVRVPIIVVFLALASRFAQKFVKRRAEARAAAATNSGVK
jgi:hypothetical protein